MSEPLEKHLQHQIDHSRGFFWHRIRWKLVRSYLPTHTAFELVDVGAGAGLLGEFLKRDRPDAVYRFVEPIASLRDSLREHYGTESDFGDVKQYSEASYIVLLDVLEHQEDDSAFLTELVSRIRPGSTLLLTVPALPRLWSQWDQALGHFRRYDKVMLRRVMANLPVSVLEMNYLFPELLPLAEFRRVRSSQREEHSGVEFPELPDLLNDVLYGMGTVTLRTRHRWRFGTSLFAAATVRSEAVPPH